MQIDVTFSMVQSKSCPVNVPMHPSATIVAGRPATKQLGNILKSQIANIELRCISNRNREASKNNIRSKRADKIIVNSTSWQYTYRVPLNFETDILYKQITRVGLMSHSLEGVRQTAHSRRPI